MRLYTRRLPRPKGALATLLLTAAALLLLWPGLARASFFDSSPGPLIRGHERFDGPNNCGKCHLDGKRDVSTQLCLDCHKAIAERISSHRGVHATARVSGKRCELCHKDHKGLDADIFGWATFGGQAKFDHNLAGWQLSGRHSVVDCKECHKQRTPTGRPSFLLAPTNCQGCHKSPHGEMHAPLDQCDRCHDARSWRPLSPLPFDHQKDARFPLETKHIGVPCGSCHPKALFRLSSWGSDCTPCHKNVHGESLFGQKRCVGCHSARVEWRSVDFDHNRLTRFALEGPHKRPCVSCHLPADRKAPSKKCDSCHKDVHQGRFNKLGECTACHLAGSWGPELRFDHDRQTRFVLTGRHQTITCRACHRGKGPADYESFDGLVKQIAQPRGQKKTVVECLGCHQHATAHEGKFTNDQCMTCHTTAGSIKVSKDPKLRDLQKRIGHGDGKPFRLTDGHDIECDKCHKGAQYSGLTTVCGPACHQDRLHKGTLGPECLRCHDGGKWAAIKFDHDKSDYPLVGRHREAKCEGCHPQKAFKPRPRLCGDSQCHLKDDAHQGSLGARCDTCHNPSGQVTFDHNDPKAPDRWRLAGKHESVRCVGCHPTLRYKPAPLRCEGCHADPQIHKGELGVRCTDCHEVAGWQKIHNGHNVFPVKFAGAHDRVRCVECHTKGRELQGMAQQCIACHQQNDVHHNSLGPNCADCHSQQTFTAARFSHDRVGCSLRGVHRVLPCVDCHKGGNYAGLSAACIACHRDDAVRVAALQAGGVRHDALTSCGSCHNTTSFRPPRAGGTDSVCR